MNDIYFTGDIHGNFEPFAFYVTAQKQLHDCHVFVCGDIGMGFYKLNYYHNTLTRINKKFKEKNIFVYFIRGNHDDPIYFTDNSPIAVTLSNIRFVKDYEIISINDHNILCVGGATSVDRIYRKENETWWRDEYVHEYNIDKIQNINDVDIVVTHCTPMFSQPKYVRITWMSDEDDTIAKQDRNILCNIYFKLYKHIKYWFYGHYHAHYELFVPNDELSEHDKYMLSSGAVINEDEYNEGCKFVGLDMLEGYTSKIDIYKI